MILKKLVVCLAPILWYVVCQIISTRLRQKWSENYGTVSTKWSRFFYWLALFGAIVISLIGITLSLLIARPWEHSRQQP